MRGRLLQRLLGLDERGYRHHALITDETGRRLAKRDRELTIRALRKVGPPGAAVRAMAGNPD